MEAKQATDLHTHGFNQRLVLQLLEDGFDLDAPAAPAHVLRLSFVTLSPAQIEEGVARLGAHMRRFRSQGAPRVGAT